MQADPIMRWVVKSRNRIVKEGDLETHSEAIGRLIVGYDGAADEVRSGLGIAYPDNQNADVRARTKPPPRFSTKQIIDELAARSIPQSVLDEATITVERRWVDRALPDHELLDALASAVGLLSTLVADAHTHMGIETGISVTHDGDEMIIEADENWRGRFPCMVTSRRMRTLAFAFADGGLVDERGRAWRVAPSTDEAMMQRYGRTSPTDASGWVSALDALPHFVDNAIRILRTDPDHGWMIFYFHGGTIVDAQVLAAVDKVGKRMLAQDIAEHVAANGFDGLAMTGEAWFSKIAYDAEGGLINPADSPDRSEVVTIDVAVASGERKAVSIPFVRTPGQPIEIGEPHELSEGAMHNFLMPVYAVWESWNRQS